MNDPKMQKVPLASHFCHPKFYCPLFLATAFHCFIQFLTLYCEPCSGGWNWRLRLSQLQVTPDLAQWLALQHGSLEDNTPSCLSRKESKATQTQSRRRNTGSRKTKDARWLDTAEKQAGQWQVGVGNNRLGNPDNIGDTCRRQKNCHLSCTNLHVDVSVVRCCKHTPGQQWVNCCHGFQLVFISTSTGVFLTLIPFS